ncbi:hypothetical protein I79_005275 [Cricetulus griseus]|uniref:Uncharacterized protein n=1 Tax=Cricetulus griseus TaxID=10029 RepID=G3H4R7_CRIGR|nr:hypothetical protein I79_005275 [Cricetulus griseus]
MPERARARAHARRHTDTRRVRLASDADSERFCVQGVAAAGIFTALIININAQSGIHPLPDLLDCGICMTLSLLPLQRFDIFPEENVLCFNEPVAT